MNGMQYPIFALIIHSDPYNEIMRNKIRESWSRSDVRAVVYFAMGNVLGAEKQRLIQREERLHNDIIQGNFIDSRMNLTYKHTMVLKWFEQNANGVEFLVKIDDNVFPNIPAICRYLESLPRNIGDFIAGPIVYPYQTVREGDDAVLKSELVDDWTVTYAFGMHLIYSYDAVVSLYEQTKTVPFQRFYDMLFLGYIRFKLNIELTDIRNLTIFTDFQQFVDDENYWPPVDWLFTISSVNEDNFDRIWKKLKDFRTKNLKRNEQ